MVLTGVELIVEVHLIPHFGFFNENCVDKILMFQLLQRSAHTQPRTVLAPHAALPARRLGCTRRWEGTQAGDMTQNDQRDVQ